ncbi:Uncharacterized protein NEOC65_001118 [Neochlamydia sp. AcF65]|nr:Uncharacterized protein [Neochlamydia sp. AcF65]MBS4169586.1 Uncharacterized protein [Neochlamydia sp. AcF95]
MLDLLSDKQTKLSHMIYKWLRCLMDEGSLKPIPPFTFVKLIKQFVLNRGVHRF